MYRIQGTQIHTPSTFRLLVHDHYCREVIVHTKTGLGGSGFLESWLILCQVHRVINVIPQAYKKEDAHEQNIL